MINRIRVYLSYLVADNKKRTMYHDNAALYHFMTVVGVGRSVRHTSVFQKGAATLNQAYHAIWLIWRGMWRKHYERLTGDDHA